MTDSNYIMHIISLVWLGLHMVGYWYLMPKKIEAKVNTLWRHVFAMHCPVIVLAILVAYEESIFKYVVNMFMTWILYDLGKRGITFSDNPKDCILMNFHHVAPVLAHLFQVPAMRYYNALFLGTIWMAHSYQFIATWIQEPLGLNNDTVNTCIKFGGGVVTGVSFGYCLYTIQFSNLPAECMTQFLCMSGIQFIGRYFVVNNFIMIKWLGQIELPISALGFMCYLMDYHVGYSIGACIVWAICYFMFYQYFKFTLGNSFPEKMIFNDETKAYIADYDWGDETYDVEKILPWYETQAFHNPDKYPLVDAIIRGHDDKVKQLLDDGHDGKECTTEWYNTQAMGWAAGIGNFKSMVLLLQADIDPYETNEWGQCQVQYACSTKPAIKKFYDGLSAICMKYPPNKKVNNLKPKREKKTE